MKTLILAAAIGLTTAVSAAPAPKATPATPPATSAAPAPAAAMTPQQRQAQAQAQAQDLKKELGLTDTQATDLIQYVRASFTDRPAFAGLEPAIKRAR